MEFIDLDFDPKALTIDQAEAINLLRDGHTDVQVAETLGTTADTVWKWRYYHPTFKAAFDSFGTTAQERLRTGGLWAVFPYTCERLYWALYGKLAWEAGATTDRLARLVGPERVRPVEP